MKTLLASTLLTGLLGLGVAGSNLVGAQPIQLRPATAVVSVSSYAIPCATDWNGDGRLDLLVGYQTASKIAVFINTGTDAQPVFSAPTNLQAAGTDIYLPSGGCGAPAPFVCDYDQDGRRDLLVGEGTYGYVYFYRNTNTDAAPILTSGIQIQAAGAPLAVAWRANPYVCDWDGDGLPDLLVGNGYGNVVFFRNTGTAQAPVYAAGTTNQANGANLYIGDRAAVRVYDWDGDGLKDLVITASGAAAWCKNLGTANNPVLQAPISLQVPQTGGTMASLTFSRQRLDLVDWNHDGTPDLLIGNYSGTVNFYPGYRLAFASPLQFTDDAISFQWHSAPYLRYDLLSGPSPNTITNVVTSDIPSGGNLTAGTCPANGKACFFQIRVAP
jgi:hypothetical protein